MGYKEKSNLTIINIRWNSKKILDCVAKKYGGNLNGLETSINFTIRDFKKNKKKYLEM